MNHSLKNSCITTLMTLSLMASATTSEEKKLESYHPQHPDMQWWRDSMETRDERLQWWREARFGCFIHWGVYSRLAGVWKGERAPGYSEHIMKKFEVPMAVYRKEAVEPFNPVDFSADEWVRTIHNAGMRYLVITAKHHDGFAMYDSDCSDYDIVDATPFKRDPMKELKAACDKYGVRLGFYYSHAQDWGHPKSTHNYWEFGHPNDKRWYNKEEYKAHIANVREYMDEKAIPQVLELSRKYDPDLFWFDTAFWAPATENVRVLEALRKENPTVVVNSRVINSIPGFDEDRRLGDYTSTQDKPAEFRPQEEGDWEAIPTTNESYGYHRMDNTHKPASYFIGMLIKCVGRGGNLLMNVGPRGDGKIDDKDVAILNGIGEWMNVNGESIHGAGKSPLPLQAWGQSTRKGQVLYLHVFDWPRDGRLTVGGLTAKIDKAYLLADKKRSPLNVERLNELDAVIHVPTEAPDSGVSTIAVEVAGEITVDTDRLLFTQTSNKFHVFDALFDGNLRCGSGHIHQDYVTDWSKSSDRVIWPVRLNEDASFEVLLTYSAHGKKPTKGGTFVSTIGDQTLSGPAVDGVSEQTSSLGMIDLKQGTFEISIKPDQIENAKFMNLHSITLRPALRASSRTVTE